MAHRRPGDTGLARTFGRTDYPLRETIVPGSSMRPAVPACPRRGRPGTPGLSSENFALCSQPDHGRTSVEPYIRRRVIHLGGRDGLWHPALIPHALSENAPLTSNRPPFFRITIVGCKGHWHPYL
jgi:hypothetical protein